MRLALDFLEDVDERVQKIKVFSGLGGEEVFRDIERRLDALK